MFRHLQDDSNWPSGASHDVDDTDDAPPPPPPRCRSCSSALTRERAATSELRTKVSNRGTSSKAQGCTVQRVPVQQRPPVATIATSHTFFCGVALTLSITTFLMVLIGLIQHREQATCAASALCTIVKPF